MNPISLQDSRDISEHINAMNAKRSSRATTAADFIVGLIVALLLSALVINFALPCEGSSLCLAAVVPTHRNLMQRLLDSYSKWRLRYYIRSAQQDLAFQTQQLDIASWECEALPRQLAVTRSYIEQLEAELSALGVRGA